MLSIVRLSDISILERMMGFEPTTVCLASRSSTPELHPQYHIGWRWRGRTSVCRYQKPMPYHLANLQKVRLLNIHPPKVLCLYYGIYSPNPHGDHRQAVSKFGALNRSRTCICLLKLIPVTFLNVRSVGGYQGIFQPEIL